MNDQDQEILQTFVEESREHLADVESELLKAEAAQGQTPPEVINQVFRCVHSIKGGAGFLGLARIKELSHHLENVVGLMRAGELSPTPQTITVLLQATDRLRELVEEVDQSNFMEIAPMLAALEGVLAGAPPLDQAGEPAPAPTEVEPAPDAFEAAGPADTLEVTTPGGLGSLAVPTGPLVLELQTGRFIYLVEFDPGNDAGLQGREAGPVLADMAQAGTILASSGEAASAPPRDFPRHILFASLLDPEIIPGLVPVEHRFIHNLTEELLGRLEQPVREQGEGAAAAVPAPEEAVSPEFLEPPAPPAPPWPREPETAAPPTAPGPQEAGPTPDQAEKTPPGGSLRVQVSLLDRLMNLAGELVLGRNQLLQNLAAEDTSAVRNVAQKINLVTSELQETVMLTRMQPVGLVFHKFPRVVRDLARSLGKEVALTLVGEEVELDKTIIEGLHDPLTHLVRNAVDHGIEPPQGRRQAGKKPVGQISLKAYHQAGQVVLEIRDDGKGLDHVKLGEAAVAKGWITAEQNRSMSEAERLNLVFRPGFSTAEKVTEVSGRGVGMDVVKSNLDKIGGQVEIDSRVGEGTAFIIKLPLTLAIIPALIVSTGGERFAIPQVNVQELLRIPAGQVKDRLETVGNAVVVRLRGQLLPLLPLAEIMGLAGGYLDTHDHTMKPDRRRNLADRRSRSIPLEADESPLPDQPEGRPAPEIWAGEDQRQAPDRRRHAASALCIAVVSAGPLRYGLVVDKFHGAEEIVIKPLGSHHKSCRACAGATIMGDGRVALVLDVANLAGLASLTSLAGSSRAEELDRETVAQRLTDVHSLLVFHQTEAEVFAVPLFLVQRLEKIKAAAMESLSGQKVIQRQGSSLPVFALDDARVASPLGDREELLVIVLNLAGREVGLLAAPPVDAVELSLDLDHQTLKQPGVMGSAIINGRTTLLLDVFEFLEQLKPDWFKDRPRAPEVPGQSPLVLLAEDSSFFRSQVKKFISEAGYRVVEAEDGLLAWELLQKNADKVHLVVTDIEMPNLDGLGLTTRIKGDQRFRHLPVIALTSLAGEEDEARGRRAGVDDYQVKLDRETLLTKLDEYLRGGSHP